MTRKSLLIAGYIVTLLLAIELTRRIGMTAGCYIGLRYSHNYVLTLPRERLLDECANRHLFFPFHLL